MPFEEGREKTGGRTKGVENKVTSKVRESFTNLLEDNLDQLRKDFKELEPKDRIKLFLDLSQYVLPKLKQTELKGKLEAEIDNFNIKDMFNFDNDKKQI